MRIYLLKIKSYYIKERLNSRNTVPMFETNILRNFSIFLKINFQKAKNSIQNKNYSKNATRLASQCCVL